MRWAVLVGALAGCNQVFALKPTSQIDARYFDAPTDAPAVCPNDGTAPVFSPTLHQVFAQDCDGYTISPAAGLGVAVCRVGGGVGIYQGPIDHQPSPINVTWPGMPYTVDLVPPPVLAADGDQLFVQDFNNSGGYLFAIYQAQSDGTWLGASTMQLPLAVGFDDVITAPTHRPDRRVLYWRKMSDSTIRELAEDASGTWTDLGVLDTTALGVDPAYDLTSLQMTADGLHLIAIGALTMTTPNAVLYTSRASLSSSWAPFATVDAVTAGGEYLFLTEDCSRIYFDEMNTVFYVEQ